MRKRFLCRKDPKSLYSFRTMTVYNVRDTIGMHKIKKKKKKIIEILIDLAWGLHHVNKSACRPIVRGGISPSNNGRKRVQTK